MGLYTRKASGLVRSFGVLDTFLFAQMNFTLGPALWFVPAAMASAFPSINPVAAYLVAGIAVIPMLLVYYWFSVTMPRSGGDYTFISRSLSPAIGAIFSFVHVFAWSYWLGVWAGMIPTWSLPVTFATLGSALNNPTLLTLASQIAQPIPSAFLVSTIIIVVFGLVPILGTKTWLRYQWIMMALAYIGIALSIGLLLVTPQSTFINKFNQFSTSYAGVDNYYQAVMTHSSQLPPEGTLLTPLPFMFAVGAVLLVSYPWGIHVTTVMGGDIKDVRRANLIAMFGSLALAVGAYAGTHLLLYKMGGTGFFNAITNMYYTGANYVLYPLTPYYNTFASILTNNPIILLLIGIGMTAATITYLSSGIMLISRVVVAWSLDWLVPFGLGDVHPRFGQPIKAMILTVIVGMFGGWVYVFRPDFFQFAQPRMWDAIGWLVIGIAAAAMPYTVPKLFATSPVSKYKIGKVPAMTIAGILTAIAYTITTISFFGSPQYGWVWSTNPPGLPIPWIYTWFLPIIAGIILYFVMKAYRRSQGIDISKVFKEIPPE